MRYKINIKEINKACKTAVHTAYFHLLLTTDTKIFLPITVFTSLQIHILHFATATNTMTYLIIQYQHQRQSTKTSTTFLHAVMNCAQLALLIFCITRHR